MSYNRLTLGRRGETLAAAYLQGLGYRIEHRNLRVGRAELDILAWDDNILVVVEVRSRQSARPVHPTDTVDEAKQRRVRRAVSKYLDRTGRQGFVRLRMDVVGIVFGRLGVELEHIRDAF